MTLRPSAYVSESPYPFRLSTKTSFTSPKSKLGLILLFWLAAKPLGTMPLMERKADLTSGNSNDIQFAEDLSNKLVQVLCSKFPTFVEEDLRSELQSHLLLRDQIEFMQMGVSYIWKLAEIRFSDPGKSNSAERTGGIRFPKTIAYSSAVEPITALAELAELPVLATLASWALPNAAKKAGIAADPDAHSALTKVMTHLSERSLFKVRADGRDLVFTHVGVLEKFEDDADPVLIGSDEELMGPSRILKPSLIDGLNFYAEWSGSGAVPSTTNRISPTAARAYAARAHLHESFFNAIDRTAVDSGSDLHEMPTGNPAAYPRNRVVVGAPGTGKSYQLDVDATSVGATVTRSVFHSAVSFAQFFGSLRPNSSNHDNGTVRFNFVPGPFIRTLVNSLLDPEKVHILLIEELNRADAAAVFGDVFQLLDRDADGRSTYSISPSQECREYLESVLEEQDLNAIRIPPNFWIWCTLNPADQGVGHLDAAFLRRWTREYIPIDSGAEYIRDNILNLSEHGLSVSWNDFRVKLNHMLTTGIERRIPEDRLIGPFFFSPTELRSAKHDLLFCDKLLNYVADDVLRHSKSEFFGSSDLSTFSSIRNDYFSGPKSSVRSWILANFETTSQDTSAEEAEVEVIASSDETSDV